MGSETLGSSEFLVGYFTFASTLLMLDDDDDDYNDYNSDVDDFDDHDDWMIIKGTS